MNLQQNNRQVIASAQINKSKPWINSINNIHSVILEKNTEHTWVLIINNRKHDPSKPALCPATDVEVWLWQELCRVRKQLEEKQS